MEKNNQKYVVMIMDRRYIKPETFIYTCNHAAVGEIDPETSIFKDNKGNEYTSILSLESLKSEVPYAYNNICELYKIKEIFSVESIKEALQEYENSCRKLIYYVSKKSDGIPFCVGLNIESLQESAESAFIDEKDIYDEEYEEEFEEDAIKKLIIDVINKKYSKRELEAIKVELEESQNNLESAIDAIELQLEAMEHQEEFKTYADRKNKKELLKEEQEKQEEEKIIQQEIEEEQLKNEKNKKIKVDEIFKKVTETLIAQDEPARRVIVELARKELDERKKKEGILLTGPTGVGKTELMRLIAKYIDRPFLKVDSTQLTVPGYVGKDIEEVLWELYIKCNRDIEKCQKAIIYFDEIDKKGSSKKTDISGQGVLNVLLPFIEGTTYNACSDSKNSTSRIKINTSNMTVILGGAYTDVYKDLLEKNTMGFGNKVYEKPTYRHATTKDFVEKGGMTYEFMGRVTVVKLNDLDINDIKRVMLESNESAIKVQKEIFNKLGVTIKFTDGYIEKIAETAIEKKTGARGINGIIDETTWKVFDEIYNNEGKYIEAILTEKTIDNSEDYQLIKKK